MSWPRALLIWLLFILAETLQGIVRETLVSPMLGDQPARQLGVLGGSLVVLLLARWSSSWIGASTRCQRLLVGLAWVALTLCFELGLGLALGSSPEQLLGDFNPLQGGFLAIGLLVMLAAPVLTAPRGCTLPRS